MQILTKNEIERCFLQINKEGSMEFKKNKCNITYTKNGKIYSYGFTNLFILAEKLQIKQCILDKLDNINIYNKELIRAVAEAEEEMERVQNAEYCKDKINEIADWFAEEEDRLTIADIQHTALINLSNAKLLLSRYKDKL